MPTFIIDTGNKEAMKMFSESLVEALPSKQKTLQWVDKITARIMLGGSEKEMVSVEYLEEMVCKGNIRCSKLSARNKLYNAEDIDKLIERNII